ncbi:hypothetical protein OC861_003857 [Tilletia horrida]|nr:hypothetical protein OC861_003857 [Tilletia horrida]
MVFNYIPAERRHTLHEYKYSGVDQSLVSRYILGPYWNWLVTLFPKTVAPNTITLSGLALVGLNFITLLAHDGALQCGVDAHLDPASQISNQLHSLVSAGKALPVSPILPRFGLPERIQPTSSIPGWSLLSLFFSSSSADASVNGSTCLPHWVYYTWALGLFLYQSLDSIDGKQARRTGMAGPLGELFDHGCDAINTTLECILVSSALNLGRSYWTLASIIATLSNFYLTTWEEYHTGTLFLSAFSGPVEGILMICLIYLITAVAGGPSFWDQGLLNLSGLAGVDAIRNGPKWLLRLNAPLSEAFLVFGAVGLAFNVVASYTNVLAAVTKKRKEVGKSVSKTSAAVSIKPLFGLIPLVVQLVGNTVWATARNQQVMVDGHAFIPFLSYWGIAFAYNVGLLIVAHVTKAPFPYWNAAAVWSVLGAIDASLATPIIQSTPERTRLTIYVSLAAAFVLYGHFCYHVITTITKEIGVPCFVVKPKRTPEQIAAGDNKKAN